MLEKKLTALDFLWNGEQENKEKNTLFPNLGGKQAPGGDLAR